MENLDLPFALRFKDKCVAQLPKSIHCRPRSIEGKLHGWFLYLLHSTWFVQNFEQNIVSLHIILLRILFQILHFSMYTCGLGRYRLSNEWKSYQMQYTSRCCYQPKILPVTLQWLSNNARTLLLHESLHWDWESPAQLSAYAENYYQFPEAWMVDTSDSETTQEIFAHQKKSILHSEWNRQTPSSHLIKS